MCEEKENKKKKLQLVLFAASLSNLD